MIREPAQMFPGTKAFEAPGTGKLAHIPTVVSN